MSSVVAVAFAVVSHRFFVALEKTVECVVVVWACARMRDGMPFGSAADTATKKVTEMKTAEDDTGQMEVPVVVYGGAADVAVHGGQMPCGWQGGPIE